MANMPISHGTKVAPPALLRVKDLSLSRGAPSLRQPFSFDGLAGWLAVIGGNGIGKSTLLLSLAGLRSEANSKVLLPQDGSQGVTWIALDQLSAPQRARSIAWMGQSEALSGRWLVADVVALGHLPWRKTSQGDASARQGGLASAPAWVDNKLAALDGSRAAGQTWIEVLGLERLWDRSVDQLSGGERQRVLIGRALAAEARVTLLDEPGLHLDPLYQMRLADWLACSRSRNKLVLTATHDLNWAFNADAILLLSSNQPPLLASPHSLDLHRAIECAMEGALTIRQVDDQAGKQWYAFPKRTVIR